MRSRSCTGGHSQNRVRLPSGTDPQSYHGMTHACGSDVAYSRLWFRRPSSPYHAVRIRFGVTQQRTHLRGSAVTPHLPSDRHTQHSLCIGMPSTRLWIAGVMSESCCNSSRHCSTTGSTPTTNLIHRMGKHVEIWVSAADYISITDRQGIADAARTRRGLTGQFINAPTSDNE